MTQKPGKPATVVRLSQPVLDGPREVSEIYLAGKPGLCVMPLMLRGEEAEIDALAVERLVAERAGLSVAAIRRLPAVDLFTILFTLFLPPQSAEVVSIAERRKQQTKK